MTINLSKKPSRVCFDGLYRITEDGYMLCNTRRSATLKLTALRPSLEYGKLVYRITVGGRKTTTIRAFLLVNEVWGKEMLDPGDYKDMVRGIDAYNRWLRESHRAKMRKKSAAPSRGICPYCKEAEVKRTSSAKTCGKDKCKNEHKLAMARKRKNAPMPKNHPSPWKNQFIGDYCMPCPWATPGKLSAPEVGGSWYSAQADPMTRGVWLEGNFETVKARSEAA